MSWEEYFEQHPSHRICRIKSEIIRQYLSPEKFYAELICSPAATDYEVIHLLLDLRQFLEKKDEHLDQQIFELDGVIQKGQEGSLAISTDNLDRLITKRIKVWNTWDWNKVVIKAINQKLKEYK